MSYFTEIHLAVSNIKHAGGQTGPFYYAFYALCEK
jgi:hypothetical protein